jgi:hypothetical protein
MLGLRHMGENASGGGSSSKLCTSCGICCSGALVDSAIVTADEEKRLARFGFEFHEHKDGISFNLPCTALNGCRCTVYPDRPACCRDFRCGLLKQLEAGDISFAEALGIVIEAKTLIDQLRPMMESESLPESIGKPWAALLDDWQSRPAAERTDTSESQLLLQATAVNRFLDIHFRHENQRRVAED